MPTSEDCQAVFLLIAIFVGTRKNRATRKNKGLQLTGKEEGKLKKWLDTIPD
jgi:hypothetical protein